MPDYWGTNPRKIAQPVPDSYTQKEKIFQYQGQRVFPFKCVEFYSVNDVTHSGGYHLFYTKVQVAHITAMAIYFEDDTVPAALSDELKIGWSDNDLLLMMHSQSFGKNSLFISFPAPFPEVPINQEVKVWNRNAAATQVASINIYGFYTTSGVSLV